MTDYDTLEASTEDSSPIEIYLFTLGTVPYRYTSAQDKITIDGDDYSPIAISRNNLTQGIDSRKKVANIVLPATNAFARRYIVTPPASKATLDIYRLQRNETPTFDTRDLIYQGSVQSVSFPDAGETAVVACQTLEAATSRTIPRHTFMAMCNHVLYDEDCGVDPTPHSLAGDVTLEDGTQITVTGVSASDFNFVGGYVKPASYADFRLVIAQSGDVLTLLIPFESSVDGQSVTVFRGCNHVITGDCALIFDNVERNGGFPFVPTKDIFRTGLD